MDTCCNTPWMPHYSQEPLFSKVKTVVLSACQKSLWLFCTLKKRHIFCENKFSQKISLRSSKSLINQAFLMAINPISSGAFAPSSSPAALLSFICSIVFQRPFLCVFYRSSASYTVRASRDNHKSRKMLRIRRSLMHKSSENVYQPEFIRLIFVCFSYMAC